MAAPTREELQALDTPPQTIRDKVERLMPSACEWYARVETQGLPQGRMLNGAELTAAHELGIQNPERIRISVLNTFPMPEDAELLSETKRMGLGDRSEGARTHGYLILMKPEYAQDSTVLSHELVHVSQLEQRGQAAFLRRYLTEMYVLGYSRSPLELEAYSKQHRIP